MPITPPVSVIPLICLSEIFLGLSQLLILYKSLRESRFIFFVTAFFDCGTFHYTHHSSNKEHQIAGPPIVESAFKKFIPKIENYVNVLKNYVKRQDIKQNDSILMLPENEQAVVGN